MHWICKLQNLQVSKTSTKDQYRAFATLHDDVHTITVELKPASMCSDFADALNKLGIYTSTSSGYAKFYENLQFTGKTLPSELLNLEVEAILSELSSKGQLQYISFTPAALVQITHYLNNANSILNNPTTRDAVCYEDPQEDVFSGVVINVNSDGSVNIKDDNGTQHCISLIGIELPPYETDKADTWLTTTLMSADDVTALAVVARQKITEYLKVNDRVTVYVDTYDYGYGKGKTQDGKELGVIYYKDNINLNKTLIMQGLALYKLQGDADNSEYIQTSSIHDISLWPYLSPYNSGIHNEDQLAADQAMQEAQSDARIADISGQAGNLQERAIGIVTVTVPSGMTPEDLARIYNTTVQEIIEYNHLPADLIDPSTRNLPTEWYGRIIKVPAYISPEDYYNINITPLEQETPQPKTYDLVSSEVEIYDGSTIDTTTPPLDSDKWVDTSINDVPSASNNDQISIPSVNMPYGLRIGDISFVVPPTSIRVTTSSQSTILKSMRTSSFIATQTGFSDQMISIELFFHDLNAINGYEKTSPDPMNIDPYYINGLRPLLALFKKAPIVPIENELINDTYSIYDVVLKDISLETVPGFPNVIKATLTVMPIDISVYMPQYTCLDEAINWPMFTWYYQQAMQRNESRVPLRKLTSLNNDIVFSLADETVLQQRLDYVYRLQNLPAPYEAKQPSQDAIDQAKKQLEYLKKPYEEQLNFYKKQKARYDQVRKNGTTPTADAIYASDKIKVFASPGIYPSSIVEAHFIRLGLNGPAAVFTFDSALGLDITNKAIWPRSYTTSPAQYVVPDNEIYKLSDAYYEAKAKLDSIAQAADNYKAYYNMLRDYVYNIETKLPLNDYPIEDLNIIDIKCIVENMMAPIQPQMNGIPAYQFLGRMEPVFKIHLQTTNRETVSRLMHVYSTSQRYARQYRIAIVSGYVGIKTDMATLVGVDAILFDNLEIDTIPNMPGVFDINMTLIAFDKEQKRTEALDRFEGIDTTDIDDKSELPRGNVLNYFGYEAVIFESKMKQMDIYPDLELPTYSRLNMALPFLNAGITTYKNPTLAKFVDPDFYISYPVTMRSIITESVNNYGTSADSIRLDDLTGASMVIQSPSVPEGKITVGFSENFIQEVENNPDVYKDIDEDLQSINNMVTMPYSTDPVSGGSSADDALNAPSNTNFHLHEVPCVKTMIGDGSPKSYINIVAPIAMKICQGTGMFPSVMIAQTAKECWWGKSCYNYCTSAFTASQMHSAYWDGAWAKFPGNPRKFRSYTCLEYGLRDYLYMLSHSSRYSACMSAKTPDEQITIILNGGYCENPGPYIASVNQIIKQHNLTMYDKMTSHTYQSPSVSNALASAQPNVAGASLGTNNNEPIQYTPDYTSDLYKQSTEFRTALARGIVFNQYGDKVVNLTGLPDILTYNGTLGVNGVTWGIVSHLDQQIQRALNYWLKIDKMEDVLSFRDPNKNEHRCIVLKSALKVSNASGSYLICQGIIANVSDYEGIYWKHYPKSMANAISSSDPSSSIIPGPSAGSAYHNIRGMTTDMCEYDMRNKLLRAFPTFHMLLIDEGRWLSWYKMWDNFYGFNSIMSIDLMKSRKMAADTCVIEMSNIYHNILSRSVDPKYDDTEWKWYDLFNYADMEKFHEAWSVLKNQPTDQLIQARKEAVNELALRPGARIHLRIGYGANAYDLPTVFNGVITETNVDEQVTIVAQGDGLELSHKLPNQKPDTTIEQEPRDALCSFLTDSGAWAAFLQQAITNEPTINPDKLKSNITHFGQTGYLPPALHSNAQVIGKTLRGIVGGWATKIIAPEKYKGIMEDVQSDQRESAYIYGLPWDNYGEPGLNIYCAAGYESMDERYYTHATYNQEGEEVGSMEPIGTKDNILIKLLDSLGLSFGNWTSKGDQPNIGVYTYDRSFWDIANTLAACTGDYIVGVVPFELRSTVFFGMPTWSLVYKYDYKYIVDDGDIVPVVSKVCRKTYSQAHIYHSLTDIVSNKIRATANNVYTNVIITYDSSKGDTSSDKKTSAVIHADTDIYPEFQKTSIVHIDINASSDDDTLAQNAGVYVLKNYLKDMYDGDFVVFGDPTVKPHDVMYIQDSYVDMQGWAGVKQVTHHMSYDSGFITNIKPDAIVEGKLRNMAMALANLSLIVSPAVSALGGFLAGKLAWHALGAIPYTALVKKGTGWATSKVFHLMMKGEIPEETGNIINTIDDAIKASDFAKASSLLSDNAKVLTGYFDNIERTSKFLNSMSSVYSKTSSGLHKTINFLKFGGATAKYGKYVANIAAAVVIECIMDSIGDWLTRTLYNRQACMVMPLRYQGLPLTAGITGSRGLVAGEKPGAYDQFLEKFFGSEVTQTIMAILGADYVPPSYDNSEINNANR